MKPYDTNNIYISLEFVDDEYKGLIDFDYDYDYAKFKLNVAEWARLSGVSEKTVLDAFLDNEPVPDVGVMTVESWESPSQYFEDPGDGGYTLEVASVIGEQDLYDILKEYMGYMDDILDKESADKLLAHVHDIASEMEEYDGYVDDSNK